MRFAHGEGDAKQKMNMKLKTETERSGKAKYGEASVAKSLGAEGRSDFPAAPVLPLFPRHRVASWAAPDLDRETRADLGLCLADPS